MPVRRYEILLLITVMFVVLGFAGNADAGESGSLTIYPREDTYVNENKPDEIAGSFTVLSLFATDGKNLEPLLKFDLSEVPNGDFTSAKFGFFVREQHKNGLLDPIDSVLVRLFPVDPAQWNESETTWNSRPAAHPEPISSFVSKDLKIGKFMWFDITDHARDKVLRGEELSLQMRNLSGPERYITGWSSDVNDFSVRPQVEFTWGHNRSAATSLVESILPTHDAAVFKGEPKRQFGRDFELIAYDKGGLDRRDAFLQFDLSGLENTRHDRVELRITVKDLHYRTVPEAIDHVLLRVIPIDGSNWTEADINWSNAPDISGSPGAVFSSYDVRHGDTLSIDVTDLVNALPPESTALSIALVNGAPGRYTGFWSKETHTDENRPRLAFYKHSH